MPASYNAALRGALKAREEQASLQRDLALMTAYFGARLSLADWKKVPDWPEFLARMTTPPRALTAAEMTARFDALAARGLARRLN